MANYKFLLRFIIPAIALSGLTLVLFDGNAEANLTSRDHRHVGSWTKSFIHTNWWRPLGGGSSETTNCRDVTHCGAHTKRGYRWLKHNTTVTWLCSYGGKAWKTYHNSDYDGPSSPPSDAQGTRVCRSQLHVATTTTTRPAPTTTTTTTVRADDPPPAPSPPTTPPPSRPRPAPTTTTTTLPPIPEGWNARCGPFVYRKNKAITETELPSYGSGSHYLSGRLPPGISWRAVRIDPQDRSWRLVRIKGKPTRTGTWTVRLRTAVPGPDPSINCTFQVVDPSWRGGCSFYLRQGQYANLRLPYYGPGSFTYRWGSGQIPPGMNRIGMTVSGHPQRAGRFSGLWQAFARGNSRYPFSFIRCSFRVASAPPTTTTTTTSTTTTTTKPPVSCSWRVNRSAVNTVKTEIGWETHIPLSAAGRADPPHPDIPGGRKYLVVTGDFGDGVFPDVWPVWDAGASLNVSDTGGCAWTAQSVVTRVRQLFMWNEADAAVIRRVSPVTAERWDRMDDSQRSRLQGQIRREWRRLDDEAGRVDKVILGSSCPIATSAANRSRLCQWGLPHPGVYEWRVSVTYSTVEEATGDALESELTVASGADHFVRLVDHASYQGRR